MIDNAHNWNKIMITNILDIPVEHNIMITFYTYLYFADLYYQLTNCSNKLRWYQSKKWERLQQAKVKNLWDYATYHHYPGHILK